MVMNQRFKNTAIYLIQYTNFDANNKGINYAVIKTQKKTKSSMLSIYFFSIMDSAAMQRLLASST